MCCCARAMASSSGAGIARRTAFKFCMNPCRGWPGQPAIELFDFDADAGDHQPDRIRRGRRALTRPAISRKCRAGRFSGTMPIPPRWSPARRAPDSADGGNQYANFVINSLFHGGVIPAVGVAVAAEREQQVGDHGDAFQQKSPPLGR